MNRQVSKSQPFSIAMHIVLVLMSCSHLEASDKGRPFTVADDIGLTIFERGTLTEPIVFSPDDHVVAVLTSRGRLDLNRCESSMRFYRTQDIRTFLNMPSTLDLSPFWIISKTTNRDGPIITNVRWLHNSSGVAFLVKTETGKHQLLLADVRSKKIHELTPRDQDVTAFDILTSSRFVYTALTSDSVSSVHEHGNEAAVVATGRSIDDLLFPHRHVSGLVDRSELWTVKGNSRARVLDSASGKPILIHTNGQWALSLSPDGENIVTEVIVETIPPLWESLYQPPPTRPTITPTIQDPRQAVGQLMVNEYVRVSLKTGTVTPLTYAPDGNAAHWFSITRADWSANGRYIVLADTFIASGNSVSATANGANQRPCVAVVDLLENSARCLLSMEDSAAPGHDVRRSVYRVRFLPTGTSLQVDYTNYGDQKDASKIFELLPDGTWHESPALETQKHEIDISIRQGPNEPPLLVAADHSTGRSRSIWNPNPELQNISLGRVSLFKWKSTDNSEWEGQLYEPPDDLNGTRYPLVIQTHGIPDGFSPSGRFTTAFAAQELAAFGIVVLQVRDCNIRVTPREGPCQVAGYESAVEELAKQGKIDPERLGIVGFSRTCYYVLETLTTSHLHFSAASITDGANLGYLQYVTSNSDDSGTGSITANESNAMIGASPFGNGLQEWFMRSPLFNMDKVRTPLSVNATYGSLLFNWEPYATLWYLKKPVELRVIYSDEHVFTNPAVRLVSQGHTVDWFRFWLKDEKDNDPQKAEQYARWEQLRKLQAIVPR